MNRLTYFFGGICFISSVAIGERPALGQDSTVLSKYESLVRQYFDFYERNTNDSAELALRQALLLAPEAQSNFLLQANLAELVLARRDTAEAISLLSEALAKQPDMEEILSRRAELLFHTGKYQSALADLDQLLETKPHHELYRYRKAEVLIAQRLWNGAATELTKILHLNPNSYLTRLTLAGVDAERGLGIEAEKGLTLLIQEYPNIHLASQVLSLYYLEHSRKAEALERIREVFDSDTPPLSSDYIVRGRIWQSYGEKLTADKDYNRAVELGASKEAVATYKGLKEIDIWLPIKMYRQYGETTIDNNHGNSVGSRDHTSQLR